MDVAVLVKVVEVMEVEVVVDVVVAAAAAHRGAAAVIVEWLQFELGYSSLQTPPSRRRPPIFRGGV